MAVIVEKDGKFLLGKRITPGVDGDGQYGFPGGKTDPGEDPTDAAVRELLEETGLVALSVVPLGIWTYDRWDDRHAVTLYFMVETAPGNPRNTEPHKCAGWGWYEQHDFPQPLFSGVENVRWVIA